MYNKRYLQPDWQNSNELEYTPTRDGYGEGLVIAGERNNDVMVLCADLTESTRSHLFRQKFPERFVECGVSEQNMVAVAVGLTSAGKVPFVSSYAVFCPGMTWNQIRTLVAYNDQKVIIAGAHAGVSVGPDGATHQALEDIALMRVLPNMVVVVPADYNEARKATIAALEWNMPIYLRFGREAAPVFTQVDAPFEIGKAVVLREGTDVTLIACGSMVYESLLAADDLAQKGIQCEVINMHTIKPLDTRTLYNSAAKTHIVVTVEEHQRIGGLGSAVAEVLGEELPVPVYRLGIDDVFGQSGTPEELLDHYGLTAEHIADSVRTCVTKKGYYN